MSKVFELMHKEEERQNKTVELIPSENFVSDNIRMALASAFSNKYAEGYPTNRITGNKGRYYGGCQIVDELEQYCCDKWKEVFDTYYHVNVQPHSGSQANMAAYMALLKPGDTVLSMSLDNGGHLSHGLKANFSGKNYNFIHYNVDENGLIDYNDLREKAFKYRPRLIVAGASAYSRIIDFERIRNIIDEVTFCGHDSSIYFMVDMAHIAGLVAAGRHPSPFGFADVITTTTQKTLRGPRGGLIFCKQEFAKRIDSAVFPGVQGGPHEHVIAAKAICAEEALMPEFKTYIDNVITNCNAMANHFIELGYKVVTGGTDNHLFLLDLSDKNVSGKDVQNALDEVFITANKNCVPGDKRSPVETSGLRIGTAPMTTKGYTAEDFIKVADRIDAVIKSLV